MLGAISESAAVWRAAKQQEQRNPRVKRRRHELEFLPAAVEVTETPASPVGRAIALLIAVLIVATLAWGWFGHVETVAVAQGKIIPGGRVKVIQPLEVGVVRAIHVEEGQHVAAGALLVELDPTEAGADVERLTRDLIATRLDIARLRALTVYAVIQAEGGRDTPEAAFDPEALLGTALVAEPALIDAARALLADRLSEHREQLAGLEGEITQRSAEARMIGASIAMLKGTVPLLAERVSARQTLAQKEYGSRMDFLELQQELVEREGELSIETHRLAEARAAVATLRSRKAELAATFRAVANEELIDSLQRAAALEQELRKAEERHRQRRLAAPVAGVVQQLAIHTVGGVVTPAENLMVVVPDGSPLEIEAMVLNKDIGFVQAGQTVEIKVESFPFTKYGLIEGSLRQVSADAVTDEQQGLIYPAHVAMQRARILVDDRWVQLAPGMAVTVEVKTGERRIVEFFLSPFLEYQDEALRER
jgi:hemolysin D